MRKGNIHFCGGFIINSQWVGTAGHCVLGRNANELTAVIGTIDASDGGFIHNLKKTVHHPEFDIAKSYHDIALVQTIETIVEDENVAFIPLGSNYVTGGSAVVSGWGDITPEEMPKVLQFADVTVIENNICLSKLPIDIAEFVYDHTLCTSSNNGIGPCRRENIL